MKNKTGLLVLTVASMLALGLLLTAAGQDWRQQRAPAHLRSSEVARGEAPSCQLPPDGLVCLRHWG